MGAGRRRAGPRALPQCRHRRETIALAPTVSYRRLAASGGLRFPRGAARIFANLSVGRQICGAAGKRPGTVDPPGARPTASPAPLAEAPKKSVAPVL